MNKREKNRYRVAIPAGIDYKGRSFIAHYQFARAWSEQEAIDIIIWQVGYPEGLTYKATRVFTDADGKPLPCPTGKRGRPALDIPPELICDTLQNSENVKQAAKSLGCSRGYIYKVVGKEKTRELVNA